MAASEGVGSAPAAGGNPDSEEQLACSAVEDKQPAPYPSHPIAQLQGPFEESIYEANDGTANEWVVELDAQTRRRDLLENDEYERLCGRRWRQRTTER